jgi:heme-degrading monooxygenase HmoA
MYLRATRVHVPADKVKEAIHDFEKNVAPAVRKVSGNLGAGLLVNRQSGEALAITYWDSAKSLGASEQTGVDTRSGTAQRVPGMQIVNVERAEVMIMDRAAEPKAGTMLRLTSATGDIDKLDAGVSHVRTKVLPLAKAQKGYRGMVGAIDRQTGRAFVSSTWDTLADLEASEKVVSPTRAESAKISGLIPETVKVEIFEAAVFDLAPAAVGQPAKT